MKDIKNINVDDSREIRNIIVNAVSLKDDLTLDYQTNIITEFIREIQLRDDDMDNILEEIAGSYIKTYTTDILKLYANSPNLLNYAQNAINSGLAADGEIITALKLGQYKYNKFILNSVADYLLD